MAKEPCFPFYYSDWLGSTSIAMMNAEQERGYLRLLCHQWASPDQCIPDDDQVLARLSLMGPAWFENGCPNGSGVGCQFGCPGGCQFGCPVGCHVVRVCFPKNPDKPGTLRNPRLYEIWCEKQRWREKSSEAGKKSAQLRAFNQTSTNSPTNDPTKRQPTGQPNTQPKGNSPSPSPSPYKEIPPISPPRGTTPKKGDSYSAEFEQWWKAYPRKVGKEAAWKAWQKAVDRVASRTDSSKPDVQQMLLAAAKEFAASDTGRGEYCPNPATWLNQSRFDDDRAAWSGGSGEGESESENIAQPLTAEEIEKYNRGELEF